jgi:hypothetical protein
MGRAQRLQHPSTSGTPANAHASPDRMAAGGAAAGVAGRGVDHGGQSVHLKDYRQKNCQVEQDSQDDIKKPFILKCVRFTRGWTACKQSSSWRLQELVIKVQRVSKAVLERDITNPVRA